uniref:ATP-dependent RNA helicase n=1 Tax=Denticeps clupeoides TaxID=299321 RepID=A0AAY4DSB1_9TELE
MKIKKGKGKKKDDNDPVNNFEKWKRKHDKTKKRVRQVQQTKRKKRDWEVEKDNIQKLVSRYTEINPKEAVKFSDFPLSKKTLKGLLEAQYRQPTEIQRQTVGFALQGKDVLGAAKTGSGKTLAFLIPVKFVINICRMFLSGCDESEKIHNTNIIICTPGRLLQHMDETSAFHASDLLMLVLDEADRILDMGFAETLNAIVENLPSTRQTLLFSATQTKSVKDLARLSLNDPEYVWVHEQAKFSTPATLEQNYVVCELHQKVNMLFSFLRSHLQKKIIVFFASCKEVQYLFRVFCRLRPGISVLALHGKQQQMKRVEVYNNFVHKKAAVLFATDIAARGLDFPAVNWVLQFDCPEDANTYIHRVGRTARYKEGGEALLLLLPSEEKGMIAQLQEKKVPINKIQVNPEKLVTVEQKLEAFLAQEKEQKERAQRCFVSYLRSIYLMKNKDVFDVFRIRLPEYAASLGLAVPPRVRFLNKAKKQKEDSSTTPNKVTERDVGDEDQSEEELESFKAQLSGKRPPAEEEDDSSEMEEQESDDEDDAASNLKGLLCDDDSEEENEDLRDLDLLTVKRKDVFHVNDGSRDEQVSRGLLNKFFRTVQQWPPLQKTVVPDEEEDDETSGINVEAARERLRREDQEFDKKEYSRKIKQKHREKENKKREKNRVEDGDEDEEDDEEEEVVAYLSGADDEFDPSALPDPDKYRGSDEEEEDGDDRPKKRHVKSASEDESEEEEPAGQRKRPRHEEPAQPLDTGLSLAEDEELVLHLLGQKS